MARAAVPRIAVVSDGSALPESDDLQAALREDADLIGRLAGVGVRPAVILAADAAGLAAGVRALPPEIGSVLLAHVEPERALAVQQELRDSGARPTMTEQDALSIALAIATLDVLTDGGRRLDASRIVLAGTSELPGLVTLLMATGVGDITTWNKPDSEVFPLNRIMAGADVLIDLINARPAGDGLHHAGTRLITWDDAHAAVHVAAGLLRAAADLPGATLDLETYRSFALALTATGDFASAALTRLVLRVATTVFKTRQAR